MESCLGVVFDTISDAMGGFCGMVLGEVDAGGRSPCERFRESRPGSKKQDRPPYQDFV